MRFTLPWCKSSKSVARAERHVITTDDASSCSPHCGNFFNYVSTRRYSWFTFLPLSLLYQFRSVSNCYFLVVAILVFSIKNPPLTPMTTLLPLLFVLAVSEIRELVEEISASKRDAKMNNEQVSLLLRGPRKARELRPGDVVIIKKDEPVRADIVLLSSSSSTSAWIETSSLDGETNLKLRKSLSQTSARDFTNLGNLRITCDPPSVDMYDFQGILEDPVSGEIEKISLANIAWRGSVLRNTDWIVGVVVYVGSETKMMMNLNSLSLVPSKRTHLDSELDRIVTRIIALQIVLCLIPVVFFSDIPKSVEQWWSLFTDGASRFWVFFILLDNLIPVSLWVLIDIIRVVQAKVIEHFPNSNIRCNSKNLHDELGRITHVLTDKTGTLTVNKMKFIGCAIGKSVMESKRPSDVVEDIKLPFDGVLSPPKDLVNSVSGFDEKELFMLCLSLCHSCERVSETMTGKPVYQTNSPDEACLVSFAAECGYSFTSRPSVKSISIFDSRLNRERVFNVLHTVAFTSDRRKMSVVVSEGDGQVLVLSKGADSVILSQCRTDDDITERVAEAVEFFSLIGYRTLCLSGKWMAKEEWDMVASRLRENEYGVENEIESDSFLIGCSAVEDRLQDNVNETLSALRAAGIKICMITGDKRETAVNIAVNCGLLSSVNHVHVVEARDKAFRLRRFIPRRVGLLSRDDSQDFSAHAPPVSRSDSLEPQPKSFTSLTGTCLSAVVEGSTLEIILANPEMVDRLADLLTSQWFESVVFCRVSPKQKGDIVQIINGKNNKKTSSSGGSIRHACSTLAIGDGANDVNMIKVASIGVGISGGVEGSQAANSSDYSIREFKELNELLFSHGRWNFRRMRLFVSLTIFKNFCFVFTQYWYASYSDFSGMSIYDPLYLMVYNTVLGVVPLVLMALFERDLDARDLAKRMASKESLEYLTNTLIPQCYQEQVPRMKRCIQSSAAIGFVCSILIFFATWGSVYMSNSAIDSSGRLPDVWMGSMIMYAAEVVVCSFFILMVCKFWNWPILSGVALTYVALFFMLSVTYDAILGGTVAGMSPTWFGHMQYWLVLTGIAGAICMPAMAIKQILELSFPARFMSLASSINKASFEASRNNKGEIENVVL